MIIEGYTVADVARIVSVSYLTVHGWVKFCESEGLKALKSSFGGVRSSKLKL